MTDDELRRKRTRDAEAAGEGAWRNKKTGEWPVVDVTFYPKLQRWITENGARRAISEHELKKDYAQLKV